MAYDTFRELRESIDGSDGFMSGHQILKIRRPRKKMPFWIYNSMKIRSMILATFPKLETDAKQRERAGRWLRIINLYYLQNWSRGQIAEELDLSYDTINSTIRTIKRVAQGLRAMDGAPRKIRRII